MAQKFSAIFDQLRCKLSTTTVLPERVPLTDYPAVTDESDDYLLMIVPSPDQSVSMENDRLIVILLDSFFLGEILHVTVGPQTDLEVGSVVTSFSIIIVIHC